MYARQKGVSEVDNDHSFDQFRTGMLFSYINKLIQKLQ